MFFKISVLRNFASFTGKHVRWRLFLIKRLLQASNFIKKRLQLKCFPVKFAKLLRRVFFTEHLRWLLLKRQEIFKCGILLRFPMAEFVHFHVMNYWKFVYSKWTESATSKRFNIRQCHSYMDLHLQCEVWVIQKKNRGKIDKLEMFVKRNGLSKPIGHIKRGAS